MFGKAMRTAVVVIAVLALTGTATAAGVQLITGAQIKNGSVGLVDLSANAKRSLKGKRGPAGPPGYGGTLTEAKAVLTVPAYDVESVVAVCPPGTVVVSGGHTFIAAGGSTFFSFRYGNGWAVGGDNFSSPLSGELTAIAYCSPPAGVSAFRTPASSRRSPEALVQELRESRQ